MRSPSALASARSLCSTPAPPVRPSLSTTQVQIPGMIRAANGCEALSPHGLSAPEFEAAYGPVQQGTTCSSDQDTAAWVRVVSVLYLASYTAYLQFALQNLRSPCISNWQNKAFASRLVRCLLLPAFETPGSRGNNTYKVSTWLLLLRH